MLHLEQLIARNWPCSRKDARRLVQHVSSDVPRKVAPALLPLTVNVGDRNLTLHDSFHLMMNKPAGCITALVDPTHETAATYLKGAPLLSELRPVGRLDLDTTGLLLWTTDGTWLHRLTHPKNEVPRTYHAALERPFSEAPKDLVLRDGHQPAIVDLHALASGETHPGLRADIRATHFATITIAGGAYHEVRRIFAALGSRVISLCRVSFGDWTLPTDLAPGSWQAVAPKAGTPKVS
jgi:16S rRNA pseudouridine516 synthase